LRVPDAALPAGSGLRPLSVVPLSPARPQRVAPATFVRRRIVAGLAATLLALILAAPVSSAARAVAGGVGSATTSGSAQLGGPDGPTHVHVVEPGETFWSLARGLSDGGDPRPVVDRLVANHGSASLHVGERLVLPGRE